MSFADVAQLAEQLICNQQVIGSSPIIGFVPLRDIIWTFSSVGQSNRLITDRSWVRVPEGPFLLRSVLYYILYGPVAQLVRAPPCHGGGREFESLLGRLSDKLFCLVFYFKVDENFAQLGEHLPYKQRVIGLSSIDFIPYAAVAELADARDLKSRG